MRFTRAVKDMHDSAGGRSLTSMVHAITLPMKIFFGLILLIISVLLALRRKSMVRFYGRYMDGIERGVLVGAVAMVIYPVMSHAFLQSAALLYYGSGPSGGFRATAPMISLAVAVVKYDQIIDYSVRIFGSGAGWPSMVVLTAGAIGALLALVIEATKEYDPAGVEDLIVLDPSNDD